VWFWLGYVEIGELNSRDHPDCMYLVCLWIMLVGQIKAGLVLREVYEKNSVKMIHAKILFFSLNPPSHK